MSPVGNVPAVGTTQRTAGTQAASGLPSGRIDPKEWIVIPDNGGFSPNSIIRTTLQNNGLLDETHSRIQSDGTIRLVVNSIIQQREGKSYINLSQLIYLLGQEDIFSEDYWNDETSKQFEGSFRSALAAARTVTHLNSTPTEHQNLVASSAENEAHSLAEEIFPNKIEGIPFDAFWVSFREGRLTFQQTATMFAEFDKNPVAYEKFKNLISQSNYLQGIFDSYSRQLEEAKTLSTIIINGQEISSGNTIDTSRQQIGDQIQINFVRGPQAVRVLYTTTDGKQGYAYLDTSMATASQQNAYIGNLSIQMWHVLNLLPQDAEIDTITLQIVEKEGSGTIAKEITFKLTDSQRIEEIQTQSTTASAQPLFDSVADDITTRGVVRAQVFAGPKDWKVPMTEDNNYLSFARAFNFGANSGEGWQMGQGEPKTAQVHLNGEIINIRTFTFTRHFNVNALPDGPIKQKAVEAGREYFDVIISVNFYPKTTAAAQAFSEGLTQSGSTDSPRFYFYNGHNGGYFGSMLGARGSSRPIGLALFCCNSNRYLDKMKSNLYPLLTTNQSDPSGYTVRTYFESFFSLTPETYDTLPKAQGERVARVHSAAGEGLAGSRVYFEDHYLASLPSTANDTDGDGLFNNVDPDPDRVTVCQENGKKLTVSVLTPNGLPIIVEIDNPNVNYRNYLEIMPESVVINTALANPQIGR